AGPPVVAGAKGAVSRTERPLTAVAIVVGNRGGHPRPREPVVRALERRLIERPRCALVRGDGALVVAEPVIHEPVDPGELRLLTSRQRMDRANLVEGKLDAEQIRALDAIERWPEQRTELAEREVALGLPRFRRALAARFFSRGFDHIRETVPDALYGDRPAVDDPRLVLRPSDRLERRRLEDGIARFDDDRIGDVPCAGHRELDDRIPFERLRRSPRRVA